MLAIKDLESLKNIAVVVVIPLFAAAYVADGGINQIKDPILSWLRNNPYISIKIVGWAISFLWVVGIIAIALALIDFVLVWIDVNTGMELFLPWAGFACLTAGLFVFSHFIAGLPESPLNPFWHLGLISYGFTLIDRSAKK